MSQEKLINSELRIIRLNALAEMLGLNKRTIYLMVEQGNFPKPIKLNKRAIGWLIRDINKWLESKNEI